MYTKFISLFGTGIVFGIATNDFKYSHASPESNLFFKSPEHYISRISHAPSNIEHASPSFRKDKFQRFTLGEILNIAEDVAIFRFLLHNPNEVFSLPACSTLQVQVSNGTSSAEKVIRSYTPITPNGIAKGYFDIIVKKQKKGKMTENLFSLKVGQNVEIKSLPIMLKYIPNKWCHIDLITGGTGIAPLLQIIHAAMDKEIRSNNCYYSNQGVSYEKSLMSYKLNEVQKWLQCNSKENLNDKDSNLDKDIKENMQHCKNTNILMKKVHQLEVPDTTEVSLLYTNQTYTKILLKSMLDKIQEVSNGRFKVSYVVTREKIEDIQSIDKSISLGYINSEMILKYLHPPHYCKCKTDKDGKEIKTMYSLTTNKPIITNESSDSDNNLFTNEKKKYPIMCISGPDTLINALTGMSMNALKAMSGGMSQQPVSSALNNLTGYGGILEEMGYKPEQVYRF